MGDDATDTLGYTATTAVADTIKIIVQSTVPLLFKLNFLGKFCHFDCWLIKPNSINALKYQNGNTYRE